ncbi:TPA: TerY-C metal binding domain-containing protein [Providencia stuartii]|uniref:TerY-C metal binding domain-containing protein n=3 Tax=Providencia stuartii TaxID=588 RepID=A0AAJ1JL22_PROST|nr:MULTISPECIES: TerY-C metal binding domain-containing protein [Providencia]SST03539.1 tellurium resistance protein [Acinetobacter baumannii]AFH93289.1 von Willebrand factor A [Providencia stuartii MRSN 2154]AIN64299.1 von Willebrand factor type A domain protein [Providencia stuartii]AVE41044.1 VWA domain-containing protein [Providencia stuartii]AXO18655.1 VWA domain-containing protein [Providencia stuartii]
MRRLPIFFVLDCSESMVGENLKKMNDGLQMIVNDLRKDPHALETAWISIIAFAGIAKTIVPLTEVVSFYPPQLPIGGGTSLGSALKELSYQIDTQVQKTTYERKGDWKPVVYLLTDGRPTDNVAPEIQRWKEKYASKVNLIAIGLGASADLNVLSQLTENVLLFTEAQEGDFTKFIKWITASVVSQSRSVGDEAPPLLHKTEQVVRLAKDEIAASYDDTCVTFVGRCNRSKRPYLMKYERPPTHLPNLNFKLNLSHFNLTGCYTIDESYFAWSDDSANMSQVNTSELNGTPGCPYCGNATAFAVCACGKLLCVNGPESVICPWCERGISFNNSDDQSDFDVTRGKG